MSVKNYNKVLCLQNLTTGRVYTIADYFKLNVSLRQNLLLYYLDKVMEDTENVKIFVTYSDDDI